MPLDYEADRVRASFTLGAGQHAWAALGYGNHWEWSPERWPMEMSRAGDYWRSWAGSVNASEGRLDRVRRSALTIHLLSFAPTGSPVAAPATSPPEWIGGDRHWDDRDSRVRDASPRGRRAVSARRDGGRPALHGLPDDLPVDHGVPIAGVLWRRRPTRSARAGTARSRRLPSLPTGQFRQCGLQPTTA